MLWSFAVAGLVGLLLGCWFRIPALVGASAVAALMTMRAAAHTGLHILSAVGLTFAVLGVLRVGYIAGLTLSYAWSRAKFLLADRYMLAEGQAPGHSGGLGSSRKT